MENKENKNEVDIAMLKLKADVYNTCFRIQSQLLKRMLKHMINVIGFSGASYYVVNTMQEVAGIKEETE